MLQDLETIYRGRLAGSAIGASVKVAACEALGLQHDAPGVRLRGFAFVGAAPAEGMPDVEFEIAVRTPDWW